VSVYYAVRTGYLYIIQVNVSLGTVKPVLKNQQKLISVEIHSRFIYGDKRTSYFGRSV